MAEGAGLDDAKILSQILSLEQGQAQYFTLKNV